MSFDEFQNQARLYVIGALENGECRDFEDARRNFGQPAEDFITECYRLHEAFALSLRPAKTSDALKDRLMKMVRERKNAEPG
ncbi:MAG: hypothetical protein ACR2G0_00340 [Chthoniobacterales bacterium]